MVSRDNAPSEDEIEIVLAIGELPPARQRRMAEWVQAAFIHRQPDALRAAGIEPPHALVLLQGQERYPTAVTFVGERVREVVVMLDRYRRAVDTRTLASALQWTERTTAIYLDIASHAKVVFQMSPHLWALDPEMHIPPDATRWPGTNI